MGCCFPCSGDPALSAPMRPACDRVRQGHHRTIRVSIEKFRVLFFVQPHSRPHSFKCNRSIHTGIPLKGGSEILVRLAPHRARTSEPHWKGAPKSLRDWSPSAPIAQGFRRPPWKGAPKSLHDWSPGAPIAQGFRNPPCVVAFVAHGAKHGLVFRRRVCQIKFDLHGSRVLFHGGLRLDSVRGSDGSLPSRIRTVS
jgi:hypothetical protein